MPAAVVIPAPIAYIKVIAVTKLVFGFRNGPVGPLQSELLTGLFFFAKTTLCPLLSVRRIYNVYFEKIRVFKAVYRLNT